MTDYTSKEDQGSIGEFGGDRPPRDAAPSLTAAKAQAKAAADSALEAAEIALAEARDRVRTIAGQTADTIHHRYGDLEAWVKEKPARALGIAAGVGVLIGLLLRGPSTKVVYLRDQ